MLRRVFLLACVAFLASSAVVLVVSGQAAGDISTMRYPPACVASCQAQYGPKAPKANAAHLKFCYQNICPTWGKTPATKPNAAAPAVPGVKPMSSGAYTDYITRSSSCLSPCQKNFAPSTAERAKCIAACQVGPDARRVAICEAQQPCKNGCKARYDTCIAAAKKQCTAAVAQWNSPANARKKAEAIASARGKYGVPIPDDKFIFNTCYGDELDRNGPSGECYDRQGTCNLSCELAAEAKFPAPKPTAQRRAYTVSSGFIEQRQSLKKIGDKVANAQARAEAKKALAETDEQ